jgi:hypothetical protein
MMSSEFPHSGSEFHCVRVVWLACLWRHCFISSPPCHTTFPTPAASIDLRQRCHILQLCMLMFKVLSSVQHLLCFSWHQLQNFEKSYYGNDMKELRLQHKAWNDMPMWILSSFVSEIGMQGGFTSLTLFMILKKRRHGVYETQAN